MMMLSLSQTNTLPKTENTWSEGELPHGGGWADALFPVAKKPTEGMLPRLNRAALRKACYASAVATFHEYRAGLTCAHTGLSSFLARFLPGVTFTFLKRPCLPGVSPCVVPARHSLYCTHAIYMLLFLLHAWRRKNSVNVTGNFFD